MFASPIANETIQGNSSMPFSATGSARRPYQIRLYVFRGLVD